MHVTLGLLNMGTGNLNGRTVWQETTSNDAAHDVVVVHLV